MVGFKRGKRVVPLREYYISAIDRAITFVQTGTMDYNTAMRSTVREMARSRLRRVTFDSGYSRRLDSQARMNILEGVRRLNADMMEETGKEFGADGVEISAHGLCAPDHQPIQGRQYSNREYEKLNQRLQRPIGTLNCHHFATPIILGVSKPVHSGKELREINARSNAPVEYRGKTMTRYEASQKQRQMETAIRYAKDERDACVAAGDKIGAAQARRRSAALGREYKSFCEKAGLTPRPERTRSMTGPTVERAKTLAKATKNDILRSTGSGDIAVTEAAIQRVPRVRPSGWDEESCSRLEEAHKELLRFVKGAPVGTEAAAVYSSKDMSQIIKKYLGPDGSGNVPIRVKYNSSCVVIHSHPNDETFSGKDIEIFISSADIDAMTVIGNNGSVYAIIKTPEFDGFIARDKYIELEKKLKELEENDDFSGYICKITDFLKGGQKYGIEFIESRAEST